MLIVLGKCVLPVCPHFVLGSFCFWIKNVCLWRSLCCSHRCLWISQASWYVYLRTNSRLVCWPVFPACVEYLKNENQLRTLLIYFDELLKYSLFLSLCFLVVWIERNISHPSGWYAITRLHFCVISSLTRLSVASRSCSGQNTQQLLEGPIK